MCILNNFDGIFLKLLLVLYYEIGSNVALGGIIIKIALKI